MRWGSSQQDKDRAERLEKATEDRLHEIEKRRNLAQQQLAAQTDEVHVHLTTTGNIR
jgi:hypothetical protein